MELFIYDKAATLEFRRRHRREVRLSRKRKQAEYAARGTDGVAREIDALMDAAIARDDELELRRLKQKPIEATKEKIMSNDFYVQYEEKGKFTPAPAGQYQGVCVEILDYGFVTKTYPNKETGDTDTKTFRQGQFVFQLNKVDENTGKRYEIRSKKLNMSSLHEKSGLRQFLTQWRGHDLTDAEKLPPGLNIGGLVGRNAIIQVIHTSGNKDNVTFANIGSIMPLMDGMAPIEALNYESQQSRVSAQAASAANGNPTHTGEPQATAAEQAADDVDFAF